MRALLAVFLLALAPAVAGAALPPALTPDPVDRAAWQGLSGVYRLDATFTVPALETTLDGREMLRAGPVAVAGTAFGVATGGRIVTADHLVDGASETLAIAALSGDSAALARLDAEDAEEWVQANGARPVGARLVSLELRQVDDPGDRPGIPAVVTREDAGSDLALLRIDAAEAPAVGLTDDRSIGAPVVAIGFGEDRDDTDPTIPGIGSGTLARSGTLEGRGDRIFTQTTIPVSRGDSGGPVLDLDGRVRGMIIGGAEAGSNIVPSRAIEEFVGRAALERPNPVQQNYLEGLAHFWALDFAAAQRSFEAALEIYPEHTLSAGFAERSTELRRAPISLQGGDGSSGFFRMLGLVCACVSLALGIALVRHDLGYRRLHRPFGS